MHRFKMHLIVLFATKLFLTYYTFYWRFSGYFWRTFININVIWKEQFAILETYLYMGYNNIIINIYELEDGVKNWNSRVSSFLLVFYNLVPFWVLYRAAFSLTSVINFMALFVRFTTAIMLKHSFAYVAFKPLFWLACNGITKMIVLVWIIHSRLYDFSENTNLSSSRGPLALNTFPIKVFELLHFSSKGPSSNTSKSSSNTPSSLSIFVNSLP